MNGAMEKAKILYIEDDSLQRIALARHLRAKGYSVTSAASGQTGLRFIKNKSFNVILCDLNMPEMSGLDVLEKIRLKNPEIPFIILSSRGTASQAIKAIKKGMDHFVLKPIEINQIVITIEQAIEKAKIQKQLRDTQDDLRMVSENVPDIIYSLNPNGEFISLSPSVEPTMGYKPSELITTSVFRVIHPDDQKKVKESFMQSVKSLDTKVKTLQFRMVSKTGEIKYFEIRRKMAWENGQMLRNDGIARDISHRIILEEKLKEYHEEMAKANLDLLTAQKNLENKNTEMEKLFMELSTNKDELQIILDTSPAVIILVDKKGIIKASNRKV
jgi:PAS domain S-box-containing protein